MVIRADAGPSAALAQAGQAGGASLSLIGGFASVCDRASIIKELVAEAAEFSREAVTGVWRLLRRRESFDTWLWEVDCVKNLAGVDHVDVGTDLFGLRSMTLYLRTGSLGWLPRTC